jgi:hypothetical protein
MSTEAPLVINVRGGHVSGETETREIPLTFQGADGQESYTRNVRFMVSNDNMQEEDSYLILPWLIDALGSERQFVELQAGLQDLQRSRDRDGIRIRVEEIKAKRAEMVENYMWFFLSASPDLTEDEARQLARDGRAGERVLQELGYLSSPAQALASDDEDAPPMVEDQAPPKTATSSEGDASES